MNAFSFLSTGYFVVAAAFLALSLFNQKITDMYAALLDDNIRRLYEELIKDDKTMIYIYSIVFAFIPYLNLVLLVLSVVMLPVSYFVTAYYVRKIENRAKTRKVFFDKYPHVN